MLLRHRRPANRGADSFTRVDVNADVQHPPLKERMLGNFYRADRRSHDEVWPERRSEALVRFADRVKRTVQPLGFVEAFDADAPQASREVELRWLVETQEQEIAPEHAVFAANGVEAFSLFTGYTDEEGGWHDIADDFFDADADTDDPDDRVNLALEAADRLQSEALAQTLDARAEEFLRQSDRQRWYSSRPKVARVFVRDDGKRSVVPHFAHGWTEDELRAILRSAPEVEDLIALAERLADPEWSAKRAHEGPNALLTLSERKAVEAEQARDAWLDSLDGDEQRAALDLIDAHERARIAEGTGYAPNEGCVQCESRIIYMMLLMSFGPVGLHEPIAEPDTCVMCQGAGLSTHTIGFDGVAAPEPWPQGWSQHKAASLGFVRALYTRTFGLA